MADDFHSFKCKVCRTEITGRFVQRGELVFFEVGELLVLRALCKVCQCELYFTPADMTLPDFLARRDARRAKIDADIAAAKQEIAGRGE